MSYVRVKESDNDTEGANSEVVEVPVDDDGTLPVSTLASHFTGATGLKYRVDGHVRIVKLKDNKLYPPETGWGDVDYYCVFPKVNEGKRKGEDDSNTTATKSLKVDSDGSQWMHTDLVVLGLPWGTTEKDLEDYFKQFGDLVMAQVKVDPMTKKSKGYGFIRFKDVEVQARVMLQKHQIDGRWCDIRIPNSRESGVKKCPCKVFVGQCTEAMTEDVLRDYFSKYGDISDLYVPRPFRGFAFVTFVESDSAKKVCSEDHTITGIKVHVTEAVPKDEKPKFERMRSGGSGMRKGAGSSYGGRYRDDDYYQDSRAGYRSSSRDYYDYGSGSGGRSSWGRGDDGWRSSSRGGGGVWDDYRSPPSYGRSSGRPDAAAGGNQSFDPNLVESVVNKAVMGVIGNLKSAPPSMGSANGGGRDSDWWSRR